MSTKLSLAAATALLTLASSAYSQTPPQGAYQVKPSAIVPPGAAHSPPLSLRAASVLCQIPQGSKKCDGTAHVSYAIVSGNFAYSVLIENFVIDVPNAQSPEDAIERSRPLAKERLKEIASWFENANVVE